MVLLGGVSLLVGLFPLLLKRCCNIGANAGVKKSKSQIFISCLACFGGGVILTTCLTHMLPEVNYFLQNNIRRGLFPNTGMPVAEILVLCGFFMIYVVEEITHLVVDRMHHKRVFAANGNAVKPEEGNHVDEKEPMYTYSHSHNQVDHIHEDVPVDLLAQASAHAENHQFQAALRGFLVILALSLHAIFEGIALGLTHTTNSVWFLFFAISSHKYVISFCVGMQFVSSGVKTWLNILYVSTFALISPIGAGIGIALSESVQSEASLQNSLVTILQGLATGTLLYVVFFEVIEKERQKGTNGILQVTFIVLGFVCMILLELVELQGSSSDQFAVESVMDAKVPEIRNCILTSLKPMWTYPMNLTCGVDGILVEQD